MSLSRSFGRAFCWLSFWGESTAFMDRKNLLIMAAILVFGCLRFSRGVWQAV